MRELRIHHLMRSGGHAIQTWIAQQLAADGQQVFIMNNTLRNEPAVFEGPPLLWPNRVTNAEDFDIEEAEQRFDDWPHQADQVHRILVLRDPWNLLASRAAYAWELMEDDWLELWKQHARLFVRAERKNQLPYWTKIRFNTWVQDAVCRRWTARSLGIPFSDAGRQSVSGAGSGSSFDGTKFDGRADKMRVLERWQTLTPKQLKFIDREAWDLGERIFGRIVR